MCTECAFTQSIRPLHKKYTLSKVLMSTYQASSGAGAEGMAELTEGVKAFAATGTIPEPSVFTYPLPFNVLPHIDAFQPNGYTKEEMKVAWEIKKIFGIAGDEVKISCTAVRVPTLRAHSEAIVIETRKPIDPDAVRALMEASEGVRLLDDPEKLLYPMPINAAGNEDVDVGRIRQSLVFGEHGLEFFVSGDQLLRGAALNAVLIAEVVVRGESK